MLNTFLAGMLLGVTFVYTGNLWLPVFFHFIWNYLQGPILGYDVSGIDFNSLLIIQTTGSELIHGGEYGFEASFIASAMLLIALGFWIYLELKRSKAKIEVEA
jgi:membrane protease YdiL (CAAX protease family)